MRTSIQVFAALGLAAVVVTVDAGKTKTDSAAGSVKGDWIDCHTITEARQDGDNQLITVTITEKLSGGLSGSFEGIERDVVHKDGSTSFSGSGSFTGEINKRSGTAVMTYSGTVDVKGAAIAHWVLDQGTDRLVKVDGHGTFEGKEIKPAPADCADARTQSAWSGTYSGTINLPER